MMAAVVLGDGEPVSWHWGRLAVFIIFHTCHFFARGQCQWDSNLWLCPIEPVSCNFIACAARRGRVSSLFFLGLPCAQESQDKLLFFIISLQYGSSKWRGVQRRSALGAQPVPLGPCPCPCVLPACPCHWRASGCRRSLEFGLVRLRAHEVVN